MMDADPILVLGATGTVGRRLTRGLTAAGHAVRAASRTAGRGSPRFDWTDPQTWKPVLDDVVRL
jgi:uncharacterized protein YbjT (DUF2867 family)